MHIYIYLVCMYIHIDMCTYMYCVSLTTSITLAGQAPQQRKTKHKGADKMTTGAQFMTQLASLMRTINSTDGAHP